MPVQATDIHKTDLSDGIDIAATDLTWWISPGVTIASDFNRGVAVNFGLEDIAGPVLINHGAILGELDAVYILDNNGGLITNATDGSLSGQNGIHLDGVGDAVTNFGSIWGTENGVLFDSRSNYESLDNRGFIHSSWDGITDFSDEGGGVIRNRGTIEGVVDGIYIEHDLSETVSTAVVNSGKIVGGSEAIETVAGALHLVNSGTLIGGIRMLGLGNDVIRNSGHIHGAIDLGEGNDVFDGARGSSGWIDGGPGKDKLTGGPGKDHFVFDHELMSTNVDHITNFKHGTDKILLDHSIFTAAGGAGTLEAWTFFAGSAAHDTNDRIIYNPANGFLIYDSNANNPGGTHHFATLAAHLTLTHNDFTVIA